LAACAGKRFAAPHLIRTSRVDEASFEHRLYLAVCNHHLHSRLQRLLAMSTRNAHRADIPLPGS